MTDKITTRARELADAALPVNFDGNLSLRAPEEGDVRLGVHNRDRDPLLISLAKVIEAAMREVSPPPASSPAAEDTDEGAPERLAKLRKKSFRKGREQGLGEAHELIVQVAEGLTKAEGDDVDAEVVSRIVVALMRTAGALRDKSAG